MIKDDLVYLFIDKNDLLPLDVFKELETELRSILGQSVLDYENNLSDGTNNPVLRLNRDVIPELDLSKITRLKTENYFNK